MTDKLLPCPFCGGKADYCETNAWWVQCNECNAETDADMSPEAAAEIWNRRTPPPSTHVIGFDPFKPACPHCTWIETNLGRQLNKKCEIHQKIEDLQSDLSLERSINKSSSIMMAEVCQIIRADDDDNPLEVARERMAEIEALEQELATLAPQTDVAAAQPVAYRWRWTDSEAWVLTREQLNDVGKVIEPLFTAPAPEEHVAARWLPIAQADKTINHVTEFTQIGLTLKNSDTFWVRDEDGRVYQAAWSEGNNGRDYWWDWEGESPVDPVEFMPHPLDPRWSATTEG